MSSESCLVCGAPGAKYHYRGLSCSRCRVFFIRGARLGKPFICKHQGQCQILHESTYKCSACRLKKCIAIGMKIDDVGTSRKSSSYVVGYFKQKNTVENSTPCYLTAPGPKIIPRLEEASTSLEFAALRLNFDRFADGWLGDSPSTKPVNLNISLAELLLTPGVCSTRSTAALDQIVQSYIPPSVNFYLSRSFGRISTSFADYMASIPEFHQISLIDKLRLAQHNYHSYVMYKTFYTKYSCHMKKQKLNQIAGKQILEGAPPNFFNNIILNIVEVAQNTVEKVFMEMRIDDIESMFLLMVTMLSTPPTLTEDGFQTIKSGSVKYITMLSKYLEENFSKDEAQRIYRIRQLLGIIPSIRELGDIFSRGHTEMVANNWGGMGSRLPRELHITEF